MADLSGSQYAKTRELQLALPDRSYEACRYQIRKADRKHERLTGTKR